MTGKVVSLAKARKAKARADRKRQADANAAMYGRSKSERDEETKRLEVDVKRLDAHRRDESGRDDE